ncbi:MAG: class III extradiol dioxygenase subunit B-like domain-containing protein [Patescibacteria group bacterium]
MITFAAFTPHSPLLLESIGKENSSKLRLTRDALHKLSEELYASQPDVILLIGTQRHAYPDAFSTNLHEIYSANFSEFGDLSTHDTYPSDVELVSEIQNEMFKQTIPFCLDSESSLDYGTGIPLTLLLRSKKNIPLVPISYCDLSPKTHIQFGRALKEVCLASKKRIAVLVAGDLAHTLTSDAPAGFHESGQHFDEAILESINPVSTAKLLTLDPEMVKEAKQSAYKSLLILFGMIERMHTKTEILSYEHPFGVGELVVQFHLTG